jgi:hypothetical protein
MVRKISQLVLAASLVASTVAFANATTSGSECGSSYDVTFSVGGEQLIGALQLAIDYDDAAGEFVGTAQSVACSTTTGAIAAFNDKDSVRTLKVGLAAPFGFRAPASVITCRFEAAGVAPTASSFDVTVEDAAVPEGAAIVPAPPVSVSSVVAVVAEGCESGPACGDGIVDDGEECDDGSANGTEVHGCRSDCTLPVACGDSDANGSVTAGDASRALKQAVGVDSGCSLSVCDVNASGAVTALDARMILDAGVGRSTTLKCNSGLVVALAADVRLGGISIDVDYSGVADASFVGTGEDVACTSLLSEGTIVAFNNDVEARVLHVAAVAVEAIDGPTPLFACKFRPGSASKDDVNVSVVDAITPDYESVGAPKLSVSW